MTVLTAPSWSAPLAPSELADVLTKLRQWTPYDGEAVLDDVGAVLDDVLPPRDLLADLAVRLRGHLARLADIAVATEADQADHEAKRLVRQARAVCAQQAPVAHAPTVGQLRRLAWAVNELLERLTVLGCLRETA
ncbi:DUF6415 family natural product biosynthesis protein [Streptomyces sp. BB1-1-1]|uniref:DUF6415 family natural product biosynthesis protein n=1 Tax=Streptomyces sp. BB1-1-1 TaxID=3074430 RepID=UPI0028775196|nr:DUF6415 family natural product biosynthesis protein [Streptomyces sp. BB1-1-1]WND39988.1 DUF6415 family natural product biosynthesis protein [Streptomyces sp. BB1-1-1]